VYQRGSLLDGLAMYLSCDTKKFHDDESIHILHNFWTSTHRGEASPLPPGGATALCLLSGCRSCGRVYVAPVVPRGGAHTPKSWLGPPNLAVLLAHCGQLILGKKTSKFYAIRCQISTLKCTKFDFR